MGEPKRREHGERRNERTERRGHTTDGLIGTAHNPLNDAVGGCTVVLEEIVESSESR
jgi:hypothetical protein